MTAVTGPAWVDTVVWWHLYPLGFVGAERTAAEHAGQGGAVVHRLPRVTGWLDYLLQLGANGLLLGPVLASTSHGYDTLDHYRVDPRLGDEGDLRELLAQARDKGIRVAFDGVFNHVSEDHEIVRRALAADATPADRAWLRWVGEYPRGFEGNLDLVELDLTHPPVQDYVVDVMGHWLGAGVDAWRLDAAFAPGADAWRPILDRVRQRHPDAWILGEVIQGDYVDFVHRSGVHSVTQYELWKAVWSSLNDVNLHELAWALTRHADFCAAFRPQTFVGNHDVTRIASKLTDVRHVGTAAALALLLPGVPSVYAGDEQGFTGEKLDQPGGDDSVRPPFPESPDELLPHGRALLAEHQRIIHLRRTHPWITRATATARDVADATAAVDLTGPEEDHRLTLGLNLTDDQVTLAGVHGDLPVPAHGWALG
ncbi:alpha-amylase [Ornithinimicrobium sp. CNJ-824]|uniref:alpha-amylase family glycosyl hydrolase n=1 Tax=Ornithinimicrobium sp. CNJ-824 TaxID=1904966 RepID=UPI000969AB25|nr:alpha-amylase family glycosyl hydrolase [Ornithinimicrobium sp. CNJ-824]OLT20968.1 alpha-amylase [Ornithinimicrobium sp. CNJ-824]